VDKNAPVEEKEKKKKTKTIKLVDQDGFESYKKVAEDEEEGVENKPKEEKKNVPEPKKDPKEQKEKKKEGRTRSCGFRRHELFCSFPKRGIFCIP